MDDLCARFAQAPGRAHSATSDFDLNPDAKQADKRALKPGAVLVAVDQNEQLLLTKRSARLKHHPGQIAFAGGRQDPEDANAVACALREAQEEVGLPPDSATVLGVLPAHETVTGYLVTPVLARIDAFDETPEPSEVDEVFRVPLAHVADPANYHIEGRVWRGQRREYYTVPWGPYYIWGATARMLRALAEAMR